jgi:Glycosyl transferase family 2
MPRLTRGGIGFRARAALSTRVRRLAGTEALDANLARTEQRVGGLQEAAQAYFDANDQRVGRLEGLTAIAPVMDWIEQATLATEPLVSVIMPTYNRSAMLLGAIETVLAQSYPHWELVIVDDASEDDTPAVLETAARRDPRVRPLRVEHGGVGAARNAGLAAADGTLVAYLDDDNAMHPGWLKSVVWGFEQRPESEVIYGAIVIDDFNRGRDGEPALPIAAITPFDRKELAERNPADISTIAHRAGLPEARFDEALVTMGDWDLLGRLCAERDPLVLPAISCFYSTARADRLTGGPTEPADVALVSERLRDAR